MLRKGARLDEQAKQLNAELLQESDAKEALRLHNEAAAVNEELSVAEERWLELQERIAEAN